MDVAPNPGFPTVEVVVNNDDGTATCVHIVVKQLPQQVGIPSLEQTLSGGMAQPESVDVQVPVSQSPDMTTVEGVVHDGVGIVQLPAVELPLQQDQITDVPDVEVSTSEALLLDDAATTSTDINSPVEEAQSPVGNSPSNATGWVTAQMLSPLPVRHPSHTAAKRHVGLGATVLTESPYKRVLEEKLKNKRPSSTKTKGRKEVNAVRFQKQREMTRKRNPKQVEDQN